MPDDAYRRLQESLLNPSRIDRVLAHVRCDPARAWRVEELAASMYLSARRFSDLVKAEMTGNPGQASMHP